MLVLYDEVQTLILSFDIAHNIRALQRISKMDLASVGTTFDSRIPCIKYLRNLIRS